MNYKTLLNDKQYEAVSTSSQFCRIVAGAGSGKTRVLTYRISYLISEFNVNPSSILAIAFTNKVASEMKTRALSLLEGLGDGLQVLTFHSFCARFLRKEIDVLGFPSNYSILDEEDQMTLIKSICVSHGFKKKDQIVKLFASFISHNKNIGKYPGEVELIDPVSETDKLLLKMYFEYEQRKDEMFALDFDDLLLRAIEILKNHSEIRTKWQNRFTNILIDEFQDTNDVQYRLVKLLLKETTALYVVGDPDQTIYTWRGANQNIILNFTRDFPLANTIILDRNYRSTKTILNTANKLISHNKKRVPKDLFTENEEGEAVHVERCSFREDEPKYVLDQIEYLHMRHAIAYKDMAILYRASYVTGPFENEFLKRRIPYQIFGSVKFFERKEVKDVLAYMRIMANPKDDISFERIMNAPRRGIGDNAKEIIRRERIANNLSTYEYLSDIEKYQSELKDRQIVVLSSLLSLLEKTKIRLNENIEAFPKIIEEFVSQIGYFQYLLNDDDEGAERVANVKALIEQMVDFLKSSPDATYEDYLENATLQSSQDEIKNGDYVSLMTIHIAKGLEFDNVFLISLVDGIFPSNLTMDESGHDGLEEERRLCYVAFTRARKRLFITYNQSYSFVLESRQIPSRFIGESGLNERRAIQKPVSSYVSERTSGYYKDDDNSGFFSDVTPKTINKPAPQVPQDNGITDWAVGDYAYHDKFGDGIVVQVIDKTMIVVNFAQCGKKTLMSNHHMLSRKKGDA